MNGTNQYLEAQVMTAPPHQLHLMVVDGAIRSAKRAEAALEEKDIETAHFALSDCCEFVSELIGGLNPEHSPEMVEQLKALFVFAYRNLAQADLQRDPQLVRNALKVLETHRETWLALIDRLGNENQETLTLPPNKADDADAPPPATGRSWTT